MRERAFGMQSQGEPERDCCDSPHFHAHLRRRRFKELVMRVLNIVCHLQKLAPFLLISEAAENEIMAVRATTDAA